MVLLAGVAVRAEGPEQIESGTDKGMTGVKIAVPDFQRSQGGFDRERAAAARQSEGNVVILGELRFEALDIAAVVLPPRAGLVSLAEGFRHVGVGQRPFRRPMRPYGPPAQ